MNSPEGISVCILAKNCATPLSDCLDSLYPFLRPELGDEIIVVDTGSTDDTPAVAERHSVRLFKHPELNVRGMLDLVDKYLPAFKERTTGALPLHDGFLADFAAARTLAHSYARNPLHFWIDSDDVLIGGAELRQFAADYFASPDPDHRCIFMQYDYSFEEDGSCNTVLWRERIVRADQYHWKGACHESLIPNEGIPANFEKAPEQLKISHKHGRHHVFSDVRNFCIMRAELDRTGQDPDTRTLFYMANCCRGLAEGKVGSPWYREASKYYALALGRSGNRDDRLTCSLNLAMILLLHGRAYESLSQFDQAIRIHPFDGRAYYGKARAYLELEKPNECLLWTQIARGIGCPFLLTSTDPLAYFYYPCIFENQALRKIKNFPAALRVAEGMVDLRPNHQAAKVLLEETQLEARDAETSAIIQRTLSLAHSPSAAKEILRRLKPEVRKDLPLFDLEVKEPPVNRSLTWLCGDTAEPWDGNSLDTGIGGSEKMVILISQALAARGWHLSVYCKTPNDQETLVNGVNYKPAASFNSEFKRGILILWRAPHLLDCIVQNGDPGLRARKVYVDMHDVSGSGVFTPARLANASGVFWKSKFHASTAGITEFKGPHLLTRNAVDLARLPENTEPRNYSRIVWGSSGDRGLLGALRIWDMIRQRHPEAEFHVYYGFTPTYKTRAAQIEYQHFGDLGCDFHMLEYQTECLRLMDLTGAQYHGRVSNEALMKAYQTSSVFLYPTKFPEISCMSAMEAQVCGCLPVCSGTGALSETVEYGTIVKDPLDLESVAASACGLIAKGAELDSYREEMQSWARQQFSLNTLVDQWEAEFLK